MMWRWITVPRVRIPPSPLYFPNSTKKSASAQLGRWILQNENLKKQWVEMGFKQRKKILSPSQVKLIVKAFGEP